MAALNFNFEGYVFQEGVRVLINAYEAAAGALDQAWQQARDDRAAYVGGVERGDIEWKGERDEEGYTIWDQEAVHDYEIESKVEAKIALRKAFVLSLYHHWERSARSWTNDDRRDHDKLVPLVERLGYPVSPRLAAVRDLANLLKHDNDKRGDQLLESWPEVLPKVRRHPDRRTDWYEAVQLTEAQLTEAFNIIAASGPDHNLLPATG